ncbi:MAG: LCP family protein [Oscillospiraceae bacterium]|nr:LCP family protein [Oscillospiraceae bacterium]
MNRRQKRILLIVVLAVVLLAAAVVIVLGMKKAFTYQEPVIENAGQSVHAEPTPARTAEPSYTLEKPVNILLIGIDNHTGSSETDRGNADGIMYATINPDTKELIFTSFMRDTRVRIENGYDKLTYVYHTGGIEHLKEIMEQNFEVPIDYYAVFGYADVAEIVEAVGGIELDLTVDEIYFMQGKIKDISYTMGQDYRDNELSVDQAGRVKLNGVQAAAYTRIRPAEGQYDAGRTERGREVISAVLSKAFRLNTSDLLKFAGVFYDKLDTNIPDSLFLQLGMNASEIRGYRQISDRIPIDGSYESGNTGSGYYVVPDMDVNKQHLQQSLFEGKH